MTNIEKSPVERINERAQVVAALTAEGVELPESAKQMLRAAAAQRNLSDALSAINGRTSGGDSRPSCVAGKENANIPVACRKTSKGMFEFSALGEHKVTHKNAWRDAREMEAAVALVEAKRWLTDKQGVAVVGVVQVDTTYKGKRKVSEEAVKAYLAIQE